MSGDFVPFVRVADPTECEMCGHGLTGELAMVARIPTCGNPVCRRVALAFHNLSQDKATAECQAADRYERAEKARNDYYRIQGMLESAHRLIAKQATKRWAFYVLWRRLTWRNP